MKNTVDKLNNFIVKIVFLLEEELNKIETSESVDSLKMKGDIIDRLNKLVSLMLRLSKYSKEEIEPEFVMSQADKEIIEQFIKKYK